MYSATMALPHLPTFLFDDHPNRRHLRVHIFHNKQLLKDKIKMPVTTAPLLGKTTERQNHSGQHKSNHRAPLSATTTYHSSSKYTTFASAQCRMEFSEKANNEIIPSPNARRVTKHRLHCLKIRAWAGVLALNKFPAL